MSLTLRNSLFFIFVFCFAACSASAQLPSTPPQARQHPTPPPPDPVAQEQFLAYWTSETGWTSELQLRNNALAQDLTVTPVLRLADGAETDLAPVTIKPQEVKSVDLDAAIAAASAPQLVGTYGSVALRYLSPSAGSLYASMMIRRTGHPVAFHIDASSELQERQAGSREGIWWLPKETTSDYLVLTNQGKNMLPLTLSLYDASGRENSQKALLGPYETSRFSVRKLLQAAGFTASYGGIKVSTTAHAGSLDTLHFLFDETAGFAAILKMFDYDPQTKLEERDYAKTGVWTLHAPMLALSSPDPALAFPPATILRPQLFVRNTTAKPVDAALRFNWRMASTTGKAAGPQLHLLPYETRRVNVGALQDGTTLPKQANWTSVTLTTKGLPDEIMAVAASYDDTLRYGAQTPFSDQLTFKWEGSMWEFDPYHNSIITAGNGGTKPTQAAFTIFYNQGTQRYDLEQTLQPDEQMWIDVGKLIREQVPDKNGRTLPPDLTMGSYEFRDLTHTGVGTLFEGKVIYDKTYGHVAYGCASCCGYKFPRLTFDPLGVPFQGPSPNGVQAEDMCSYTWVDVSDSFVGGWNTANTAVATVDGYGTHTGVSIGSTTSTATGGMVTYTKPTLCPTIFPKPQGGVNVNPSVTFGDTPLVPLGKPVPTTATVNPSTNTTPITLTISTTSGTGSATFSNGYTTMTITTTTSVTLVGVTASSTPNNMQLTATVGSTTVGSMIFTVTGPINGAIPVNYRQTLFRVDPSAILHFEYKWDSSTGNLADLSSCQVEESVTYVGPNPYSFATPPYAAQNPIYWPYTGYTPVSATTGTPGLQDDHGHWPFQGPYVANTSSSDQVYQFTCTNYQPNVWTQLMPVSGQIPITRLVRSTNGAPPWTYQITKYTNSYPYVASMNLP